MPTYYTIHASGDKGSVSLTASAYVARLDADGGLHLDAASLRACLACVPDVTHIYCKSEAMPLEDPALRFTITRSPDEPGRLSLTTYSGMRPQPCPSQAVDGPWWKVVVQALKALPECAAALGQARAGGTGQVVWHVAPEPA
jgi:hypothetical protein